MRSDPAVDRLSGLVGRKGDVSSALPWVRVEASLGAPVPPGYRAFAEAFGSGVFDRFVSTYSPVQTEATLERFLDNARGKPTPEEGAVPWGSAGEGCSLYVAADDSVLVCDASYSVWERHPGPVAGFLAELLTGGLDSVLLPYRPVPDPPFVPVPVEVALPVTPVDPGLWRLLSAGLVAEGPLDLVDELVALVGAPATPSTVDWDAVERDHGIVFPADYKRLVDRFGGGRFGDIRLCAPGNGLTELVAEVHAQVREFRPIPGAPYHPEPGGLVPWARLRSGDVLFWAPATDDPDTWPVLLGPVGHNRFPRTASSVLHDHVTGDTTALFTPEGNGNR